MTVMVIVTVRDGRSGPKACVKWLLLDFYIKKNLGGGYSLNLVLKVPKYHEDHKKIKFGAIGVGKDGGITIDAKKYRFRHL